ncbi:MAG: IMP cyclohydrolase [Oscillospiraceae bacterium]
MKILELDKYLSANSYPGRGILLGRSADNQHAVIAYFIMGRSVNSRNRVFTETADGIRTEAYDPSKMEDPSLIIYHPVRVVGDKTVVTNGDQTDTIRDALEEGHCFRHALMTREFEPDGPNYTPRISGIVNAEGDYKLSILKSLGGDPACCCRYFFEYDAPKAGLGHIIHTYEGDGNPLPSFEGEPRPVAITAKNAAELAELLWKSLNEENKVSLFVQYINLADGTRDTVILNKHTN